MKVGIIGCGQIGGSIALKLSERDEIELSVYDINPENTELLKSRIPIINIKKSKRDILNEKLDLLVLAVPISECIKILNEDDFSPSYIITDVCSVKKPVIEAAKKRNLRFIGGHPIAGNERIGPDGWDKDMFKQKKFCICTDDETNENDLKIIKEFIEKLDAVPYEISSEKHDEFLSYTSHMTYLVSLALRLTCEKFSSLAGPGYQSTTRVGRQNPHMSIEILKHNKENVLNSLKKFKETILNLEELIESENWEEFLKRASQ
ncbi:MAG: prephenate dehydrogenase [Thermotogaceae bacterium]|nr:prephenate dehydrogenase [Thermotogaceae bacterium]